MKKTVLLIGLFALCCGILGAQDDAYRKTRILIEGGLSANLGAISSQAAFLDASQKGRLFDAFSMVENQKNLLGAGINFLVGFGVGSYIIGDVPAGLLGTVLDVGGYVCIYVGYFNYMLSSMMSGSMGLVWNPDTLPWLGLLVGGLAVKLGSTIYQCLSPFSYARGYDAVLAEALGLASAAELRPFMALSPGGNASLGLSLAW